jgi:predicted kinase
LPGFETDRVTQPECVIFVGLQASGKTTFYRERFASSHEHISKDNFPKARDREMRQTALLDQTLACGRSVVMDNTNPTPADRRGPIAVARAHGARVVGYFFESAGLTSLGRNRRREGKARVPDVAILATAKRLVPPLRAEGFDEIYTVRLTDQGAFEVSPSADPANE